MSYSKNPGCESFEISLYYVRAEGPNDTLHYLWDFTNKPTVFLALTDPKDNLTVNCVEFALSQSNAFNFTQTPKYVFFLLLNKVSLRHLSLSVLNITFCIKFSPNFIIFVFPFPPPLLFAGP